MLSSVNERINAHILSNVSLQLCTYHNIQQQYTVRHNDLFESVTDR